MAIDVSDLDCDCPKGCKCDDCEICVDKKELEIIKRMGERM